MNARDMRALLMSMGALYEDHLDELSALDAAIADGDHGVSMVRGFRAVGDALADAPQDGPVADVLNRAARVLMKAIGGTCGPLYAMFFMKGAAAVGGAAEFGTTEYYAFLKAGCDAIMALGKARPGGKTMVDALVPAVDALDDAKARNLPFKEATELAAAAAARGRDATADMRATVGRARYQSDGAVGHVDAGAASMALLIAQFAAFA